MTVIFFTLLLYLNFSKKQVKHYCLAAKNISLVNGSFMIYDPRPKIDRIIKERGITRSEPAHRLGISSTSVQNWYNEKDSIPALSTLEQICPELNISPIQLFLDGKFNDLTSDRLDLLQSYGRLPAEQQKNILSIVKNLAACYTKKS